VDARRQGNCDQGAQLAWRSHSDRAGLQDAVSQPLWRPSVSPCDGECGWRHRQGCTGPDDRVDRIRLCGCHRKGRTGNLARRSAPACCTQLYAAAGLVDQLSVRAEIHARSGINQGGRLRLDPACRAGQLFARARRS